MKNVTVKLMVAAAVVAAAGVASAQTLEANIPFAFRAGGKVFAPGTYQVRMQNGVTGNKLLFLSGANDRVLTISSPNGAMKKGWVANGRGVLSFQCGASKCALRQIWTGEEGAPVYVLPAPKLGRDEATHTADISLHVVKGD